MSGTYSKVIIVGRLGQNPELRYSAAGTPVCNMSLATDEGYTDSQGQKIDRTEWHKVVVFGRQAENAAQYLAKGRTALVEGSLQTDKWTGQDGVERYTTKVKAFKVVFLGGNGKQQAQQSQAAPAGDPFEEAGPAFPSEAGAMDDAPF